jgi:hypothetical protein
MPVYMMPWFSNSALLRYKKVAAVYRAGQLFDSDNLEVRPRKDKEGTIGTTATLKEGKNQESRRSTEGLVHTHVGLIGFGLGMSTCDVSGCGGGCGSGAGGGACGGGACGGACAGGGCGGGCGGCG